MRMSTACAAPVYRFSRDDRPVSPIVERSADQTARSRPSVAATTRMRTRLVYLSFFALLTASERGYRSWPAGAEFLRRHHLQHVCVGRGTVRDVGPMSEVVERGEQLDLRRFAEDVDDVAELQTVALVAHVRLPQLTTGCDRR